MEKKIYVLVMLDFSMTLLHTIMLFSAFLGYFNIDLLLVARDGDELISYNFLLFWCTSHRQP